MNLDPSETQTLLRETVRGYLDKEVPLDRIRELEREGRADATLWRALCDQGWLALPFADVYGGGEGSLLDAAVLVEQLARRAALVPVAEALTCGLVLQHHAPDAAAELLPALLAGNAIPVPAVAEADRSFGETALEIRDGRLTGEKSLVDYAQTATHHLVTARGAHAAEMAVFLVDARAPEVQCEPARSIGRIPVCSVSYADAVARPIGGAEAASHLIRLGRAFAAVQCVGSMQEALDQTVAYACVREQFGKPIGSFQAVRHHAANMAIRVTSARLLSYEALSALDAGVASDRQVAAAKASASRAVPDVTMLAHQIHGGNGVIEENDLYFFTLRGKEHSLAWGSADECLEIVSAGVDAPAEWL